MKCFVSEISSATKSRKGLTDNVPCVTKLPKFLPTMQCHVAPFLASNCRGVISMVLQVVREPRATADLFLDILRNVLGSADQIVCSASKLGDEYLLNVEFAHSLRSCYVLSKTIANRSVEKHIPYQLLLPLAAFPRSFINVSRVRSN